MNYLLDTCVLSEFTRHKPNEEVVLWMESIDEDKLFISAITIGEIQHGIERLPESHRKTELLVWMNNRLIQRFGQRILPLDTQTMFLWGSLIAQVEKSGQPMPVMDSLIAATALFNNLIIVTRNGSDFLPCGVQVINPWDGK
jgi:toxin FitB